MNVKNSLKYYDSVREPETGSILFISVGMRTTEKGLRYFPNLKIPNKKKDFNDWWNGVVIISHDLYFTRKTIITTVANQDGGTHVDPLLDTKYANLSRNNGIGWEITFEESGEKGVTENGPELPLVRQIAHELHLTLSEQLGV